MPGYNYNTDKSVLLQENSSARFTHIAAMHSELVAVNVNGQLCQWKWSDPEPFHNKEVSWCVCACVCV